LASGLSKFSTVPGGNALTIAGYEAIHMIRKGQACGSALAGRTVLLHRFILGLFSAVAV
jgi:hypothetical protein